MDQTISLKASDVDKVNVIVQSNPSNVDFEYRKNIPFEKRKKEADFIMNKYPGKIPVICEVNSTSSQELHLDKKKYLVPADITVGQFIFILRKRIRLLPESALFLFVNGEIPPTGKLLSEIYHNYKDLDGFVYCAIARETNRCVDAQVQSQIR